MVGEHLSVLAAGLGHRIVLTQLLPLHKSEICVHVAEYFVGSPGHSFLRPHDFLLQLLEFVMCWFSARFWSVHRTCC